MKDMKKIEKEIKDEETLLPLCLNLKMLFQSCQTATKSFLLQNSLMGVGTKALPSFLCNLFRASASTV